MPGARYLVAGGKEGVLYVLDRANFGGYDRSDLWTNHFVWNLPSDQEIAARGLLHDDPAHDHAHQKFTATVNTYANDPQFGPANRLTLRDWMTWPHIHGTPVFARLQPDQSFLYVWGEKDRLKRFAWLADKQMFDPNPLVSSAAPAPPRPFPDNLVPGTHCPQPGDAQALCPNFIGNGMPGGFLSVNLDDESHGGVVFASVPKCRQEPGLPFPCKDQRWGALRAFDPRTLEEVWNNDGRGAQDDYWFIRFVPPTIANSRVFLATGSGKVIVYGR